jgi:hypothetical protein
MRILKQETFVMTRLVALDRNAHKDLRILNDRALSPCATANMVTVVVSEIPRLVIQYPIVLTRSADNSRYVPIALFGLENEQNLFWRNNQWEGVCMPLNIVRQPFYIGFANPNNPDPKQMVALVDMENPGVQTSEGELLFDEKGEQTLFLKRKLGALAELMEFEAKTQQFVDKLNALGLITPMGLEVKFVNEEKPRRIGGLFTVAEDKVRALSKDTIGELHSLGYLAPIYAMMCSLGHIYSLLAKRNTSPSAPAAEPPKAANDGQ